VAESWWAPLRQLHNEMYRVDWSERVKELNERYRLDGADELVETGGSLSSFTRPHLPEGAFLLSPSAEGGR
jgi:hypothetical protein